MLKMTSQVENVVNAYKTLTKIPSIVGASLNNTSSRISAKWSVRNLDKGKPTKYVYDYYLDNKLNVIAESDFGIDVSNEILSAVSPSERFKAVIREEKDNKDNKKQFLEIWSSNQLIHSVDLLALEIHGDVYADSEFGSLDWSPDESSIVYVAEKKLPKSEPYIKRKSLKDSNKNETGSGEALAKKGEEYLYKQDWGEQLVGKHLSVVVICNLPSENFTVLNGLPDTWCPGQVIFSPDGLSVVGAAWITEPRRLGLIFCTNRPSFIFSLNLNGTHRIISHEGLAVRSPRFNTKSDRLVWLQRPVGGPHHSCHQLATTNWPLGEQAEVSIIVDIIPNEVETANGVSFHGIYSLALPRKCFSDDGKRLLMSTPQMTSIHSYVVDIETRRIVDISKNISRGSLSVLYVKGDLILAASSSFNTPPQLMLARLNAVGSEDDISWQLIGKVIEVPDAVKNAQVQYLYLKHENSDDEIKNFSALYTSPAISNEKKLPLVVWPHGGPHSGFVDAFSLDAALFSVLGFACLQVNYRGSVGQGQLSIDFLTKRIGTADVLDCKLATDRAIEYDSIDRKKLCLFGGSHGGFLVCHLSGQYPDTYAAVVTRNPVIDVSSMFNSTDIPDWCAVEAGFDFTEEGAPSEEQLLEMRRKSPIVHAHCVKAPTALMLGSLDKRVPHYQGLEYYRRLKANGCVAKLYMYEDNHSLSSQIAEMDNLINSVCWFLENSQ